MIFLSGQSQTSSSVFLRFAQVHLTDVGAAEAFNDITEPPGVDAWPGKEGSVKFTTKGIQPRTSTAIDTSSQVEMREGPRT